MIIKQSSFRQSYSQFCILPSIPLVPVIMQFVSVKVQFKLPDNDQPQWYNYMQTITATGNFVFVYLTFGCLDSSRILVLKKQRTIHMVYLLSQSLHLLHLHTLKFRLSLCPSSLYLREEKKTRAHPLCIYSSLLNI